MDKLAHARASGTRRSFPAAERLGTRLLVLTDFCVCSNSVIVYIVQIGIVVECCLAS